METKEKLENILAAEIAAKEELKRTFIDAKAAKDELQRASALYSMQVKSTT